MRRGLLFVVVLALLGVGCSKGNFSETGHEGKKNVFRYPIPSNPTTLDPGKVEDGDTIDLLQQVYEGLVGWDENSKVAPRLAKSWDISNDGTVYTFHLREDAKFTNGRPVTAADFKWTMERNCMPSLASTTVSAYISNIVGVTDMRDGKAKEVSGLKVIDDHTLEIKIDKPRPYFVAKLTYPCAFAMAKEALKDPGKEIKSAEEMVGTGPFKVKEVKPDQVITLSANDQYYGGKPKIDGIERPVVGDASTRLAMFKSGDIDLVQLQRQDALSVKNDPKYKDQLQYFDRPAVWYIGLNCNLAPALKNPNVRRAIAMAIDKDHICNDLLSGVNPRADGILPPKVFGHRDTVKKIPYDPAAAKQLLAQAGFPNGANFPELTMYFRQDYPDIRIVATAVGEQLGKNLNIHVTFKSLEWSTYLGLNDKNQLPFFHMRWGADYLDAENFLSTLLASYGAEDHTLYHNAEFDALCAKADVSMDPQERMKLYAQAEDIALQEAPMVPIYFQRDAELISPRVHGIRESLFGHLPHTTLSLQ